MGRTRDSVKSCRRKSKSEQGRLDTNEKEEKVEE